MESINCIKCDTQQKLENNFCSNCGNQTKCLSCSEMLIADANFCVKCGDDIKNKKHNSSSRNTFELNETKESRTIKAEFSDSMGSNMTETLAQLVTQKFEHKQLVNGINESVNDEKKDTESVIDIQSEIIETSEVKQSVSSEFKGINTIFRDKDEKIKLLETNLKASGKTNYAMRLTYLLVLFYKSIGQDEVNKSVINDFLNYCGVYDGNYRLAFSKAKAHFMFDSGIVEFRPAGLSKAKEYLNEILNEDIVEKWSLSDLKSSSNKKKSSQNKNQTKEKKPKSTSRSLSFVEDLNLRPKNGNSLSDFYKNLTIKTNFERNLVFIYYLQHILKIKGITVNHIYTCYKNVNQRVPKNLYQSLTDTKSDKGWIKTQDRSNIVVTTTGENVVEYDLKLK